MPTENDTITQETQPDANPDQGQPTVRQEGQSQRQGTVLTIPSKAMAEIKAKERERGKQMAMAELEKQAKELGYRSFDDMKAAMAAGATRREAGTTRRTEERPARTTERTQERPTRTPERTPARDQQPARAQQAAAAEHPRYTKKLEQENARLIEEKKRLNRLRAQAEKREKAAQRELQASQAEVQLRMTAFGVGIQAEADVDYALNLLRREVQGKTTKQLEALDERKFFEGLRETRPYLFGVETRPAETGSGPPAQPVIQKPPMPGQKPSGQRQNEAPTGRVDALTMSPKELEAHYRKMGITPPNGSYPS